MIIDWPEYLPCFQLAGSGFAHHNNIQNTEFDSGHVRSRVKPEGPVTFDVSLVLTSDQLAVFEAWRKYDLNDIGWFKCKLKTGLGLEDWVVKLLVKNHANSLIAVDLWRLGFQVQARKPRFIDQFSYYEKNYGLPVDFGTQTQNALNELEI